LIWTVFHVIPTVFGSNRTVFHYIPTVYPNNWKITSKSCEFTLFSLRTVNVLIWTVFHVIPTVFGSNRTVFHYIPTVYPKKGTTNTHKSNKKAAQKATLLN